MQADEGKNKGDEKLTHPFAREFNSKELAELAQQISPEGISIPGDIKNQVDDVLDGGEVESVVPEEQKWEVMGKIQDVMKSGFKEEILPLINSNETKQTLGNDVIFALNYLLEAMDREEMEEDIDLDSALSAEDSSSEPAEVQILNNIMNALNIPDLPLGEIEELYVLYKAQTKSVDFNHTLRDRMADFMHLFEDNLAMQIKEAQRNSAKNLKEQKGKSDDIVDIYGREADYWATMTPQKLYKILVRRITLENMAEERISFEKVKEIAKKLYEMKHKNAGPAAE